MSHDKTDALVYNISGELKCELCNSTFKTGSVFNYPFKTIKLCKECIEKDPDQVYNFIFEFYENEYKKINCPDIKGKEFEGEYLTWKHLKDYLNKITDEEILNLPVITQEHHHFTFIKFNSIIQLRLDEELKDNEDGDEIRNSFERFLNIEDNDQSYFLEHPKQFNLSDCS